MHDARSRGRSRAGTCSCGSTRRSSSRGSASTGAVTATKRTCSCTCTSTQPPTAINLLHPYRKQPLVHRHPPAVIETPSITRDPSENVGFAIVDRRGTAMQEPGLKRSQLRGDFRNGEIPLYPLRQFVFGGFVRKSSLGGEERWIFGELGDESVAPDQGLSGHRARVDGSTSHRQTADTAHIQMSKYDADFIKRQTSDE